MMMMMMIMIRIFDNDVDSGDDNFGDILIVAASVSDISSCNQIEVNSKIPCQRDIF